MVDAATGTVEDAAATLVTNVVAATGAEDTAAGVEETAAGTVETAAGIEETASLETAMGALVATGTVVAAAPKVSELKPDVSIAEEKTGVWMDETTDSIGGKILLTGAVESGTENVGKDTMPVPVPEGKGIGAVPEEL